MRIEAYTQVQQLYQNRKVNKTQQSTSTTRTDEVQISSLGKDIQTAKAAVNAAPDVREDVVSSLKSQVQSGNYQVENSAFAQKLMEKYEEMR